ncbi:polyprotein [Bimiti virus]|uniref:Envelopment polyprotein n=1 Tax=Bimiti virus TaxID=1678224 RepID=A0A0R7FN32_9VIRU|nr:polyprotein [Bimiti virus]AKO90172.1 polyprotein [Bimiti virus]
MATTLILMLCFSIATALPVDNRCFSDGIVSADKHMDHGIAEICVKDDISIVKTTSVQFANTTKYANVVLRKMLIQNYEDCNPVEVPNGPIMIFKPNADLMLIPHTFACRTECTISLNEEEATIILHSDKLNHYEIMGTTTANRWFQGSTSYSLEHTCEHIQVTCGANSLGFHACFKYHMACIRLMNKSYMPAFMIQSVCKNKELIIMGLLILIIFGLLYFLTLTYICYILIPIFYPITYLYGILYNKSCKKCYYCGLAYHPFSKCGKNCVCGCMFENSDRMKKHRESGMCHGYKSLRAARILCKNRGSAFILSFILAFLLLSFVQPIEGIKLSYNNEIIELDSVTDEFNKIIVKLEYAQIMPYIIASITAILSVLVTLVMIFGRKIERKVYKTIIYECKECNMIHPKKNLVYYFNGDFTNRCNSCMCGCNYNAEFKNDESDYMIPMDHELSVGCTIPGRYYAVRKIEKVTGRILLGVLIFLFMLSIAYAEDDKCAKLTQPSEVTDPLECSVWHRLPTNCQEDLTVQSLFRKQNLPEIDIEEFGKIKDLNKLLQDSEQSVYLTKSYILETGALKVYCKELAKCKEQSGNYNARMMEDIKAKKLEICATGKADNVCKCFEGNTGCVDSDGMNQAILHYKSHLETYKNDVLKVISSIMKVYPGILSKQLGIALRQSNFSKVKEIATKMKSKFGSAQAVSACFNYLEKTLATDELVKLNPNENIPAKSLINVPPTYATTIAPIFNNIQAVTAPIKHCKKAKMYRCTHAVASVFDYYITCDSKANEFYQVPRQGISYKMNVWGDLCVGDPFCDLDFLPVSDAKKNELLSLYCIEQYVTNYNFSNLKALSKCYKLSTQTCLYKNQSKTFIECSNGYFYEYTQNIFQSGSDEIGVHCFDKNCRQVSFPHHVDNLSGCKLHTNNMKNRKLKEIVYENIEQLRHSIQEAIKTDLIQHKYLPTMNLPKIAPSFKPISIQGIESDSGVDNAYIETNVIVRSGVSTGLTLYAKDGSKLFDIVIFVKSAHYESNAVYAYSTGPTVGINLKHEEKCTGSCPENLKKDGWLSFSKEHTSQWGCEEFGCLAINDGCVFGHCQDIIKPDLKVYKSSTNGEPKVEICITIPGETYCHTITAFTPIVSDQLEIQFLSNEAGKLPKIFGYKSNKVLTGMINDKAVFSRMCGSVQSFDNSVWGTGNPRFDYICHAAKRKDIVVSRCYDNFYESCLNLNQEKDLVFDDKTSKIMSLNKLLGEIRVKVKLGDIRYKVFEKNPSMDIKLSCVGCLDCSKGVDCEISIISSSDTVCAIESNCQLYHNNIKVEANTQKYGIKAKCSTQNIEMSICKQKVEASISLVTKHETIEVGNSDQTYTVHEKDLRCGTWLCKVADQGIGAIFSPFFSIFGTYGKIAFYSVLGIIILVLLIYLLLPVCGRFKDLLKRNDIEYHREMYGYKPLTVRR